jgi:hypothetical protein
MGDMPLDIPAPPGEDPAGGSPVTPVSPPPRRRRWPWVLAGVVALLVVSGAAFAAWRLMGSGEVLLTATPADADLVVTAYLDPDASQKVNLLRMATTFPDAADETAVREQIDGWMDDAFEGTGLNHDDLDWVGPQMLLWGDITSEGEPVGALLIAVADAEAATAAMGRVAEAAGAGPGTTTDVDGATVTTWSEGAWALDDDVLIVGSDAAAVERTLAAVGDAASIETTEAFTEATADLPVERLALIYADAGSALEALPDDLFGQAFAPEELPQVARFAMTISAEERGLAIDATTVSDPSALDPEARARLDEPATANAALGEVPADAFFAVGATDMDVSIDTALDALLETDPQAENALGEMGVLGPGGIIEPLTGDVAMSATPSSGSLPVEGTIVVGTTEEVGLVRWLEDIVRSAGVRVDVTEIDGLPVGTIADAPVPVSWALGEGSVVLGTSPAAVAEAVAAGSEDRGLVTTTAYTDALGLMGGEVESVVYLDVPAGVEVIGDAFGPDWPEFGTDVEPYLEPFGVMIAGGSGDASVQHARVFIEIG